MILIGRMPFPVKETYKNTIAFEPFRVRSEIRNPATLMFQSYRTFAKKHADKTKNGSLKTLVLRGGKVEILNFEVDKK